MENEEERKQAQIARRRIRERDKRAKKLLIVGLLVVFVLYCLVWHLLTRGTVNSPGFQLQAFAQSIFGSGEPEDIPTPPPLEAYRSAIDANDLSAFEKGLRLLVQDKEYRQAGRVLWPIAARHPQIRPSIAHEYLKGARRKLSSNPSNALLLARMALAYNSRGFHEHMEASSALARLNQTDEADQHQQLAFRYLASWHSRSLAPPSMTVGFFLLFVISILGMIAYYYWDELGLVEKFHLALSKARHATDMALTRIRPAIPRDESGVATSPGDPISEVNEPEQAKGSITGILKAEGFLKDVQDFFDQKNYELAVDMCQKAIELNPANSTKVAQICLKEGVSLYDLGDFDQAIDLLEVSLHFAPHTVQAHLCLGNCHIKLGRYDKAQEHYEQVISITPQNTDAYYTLGVCYQKTKNLAKARRSFEVAVRLRDHPNSHFYLAKICETESDLDGAIHHWESFITLAPDNPQAPSARKRLETLKAQRDTAQQPNPA